MRRARIERIAALAEERAARQRREDRWPGGIGEHESAAAIAAWVDDSKPLTDAVAALSERDLVLVAALLFSGRGDGSCVDVLRDLAGAWSGERVRAIVGRPTAGQLIREGLRRLDRARARGGRRGGSRARSGVPPAAARRRGRVREGAR